MYLGGFGFKLGIAFCRVSSLLSCDDDGQGNREQQPVANPCFHVRACLNMPCTGARQAQMSNLPFFIHLAPNVTLIVHTYEGIVEEAVIDPDLLDTLPEHAVCTRARAREPDLVYAPITYQYFHDRDK